MFYSIKFGITGHNAHTLSAEYIGSHEDGWVIEGEIYEDYYKWVNDFSATKGNMWVRGNFEEDVIASSKKAYDEFIAKYPPQKWDYWDI